MNAHERTVSRRHHTQDTAATTQSSKTHVTQGYVFSAPWFGLKAKKPVSGSIQSSVCSITPSCPAPAPSSRTAYCTCKARRSSAHDRRAGRGEQTMQGLGMQVSESENTTGSSRRNPNLAISRMRVLTAAGHETALEMRG